MACRLLLLSCYVFCKKNVKAIGMFVFFFFAGSSAAEELSPMFCMFFDECKGPRTCA